MILSRYLIREVFGALLAVTFILLLILLSNQLVRYLGYAASGKLAANVLLQLLGFEIPYLLGLLLPLGLFLGVILAYGRLYAEQELTVMLACGLSQKRLMMITGLFTVLITGMTLVLTLWVNPIIALKKQQVLLESMSTENILATIMPGRFQVSSDGRRVVYVESVSRAQKAADNLFFADQVKPAATVDAPAEWSVVSAAKGYIENNKQTKQHFLVAEDGYRYEGIPGQNDYKLIQFQKYSVEVPATTMNSMRFGQEAIPTQTLWDRYSQPNEAAELQWRISIPISVFLLSLLAVPLSHVKPRQSRYASLFPAILIYVIYMNLLFVARNWMESKLISNALGMWWVHGCLLLLLVGVVFFQARSLTFLRGRK